MSKQKRSARLTLVPKPAPPAPSFTEKVLAAMRTPGAMQQAINERTEQESRQARDLGFKPSTP